jgi:hypothetical protein
MGQKNGEMAEKFGREIWLPLTCRKSATWDRRLYFPSEGRHAEHFFAQKIRRLWPGLNLWSWVPEASMLTTRPPKPLFSTSYNVLIQTSLFITKFNFHCTYRKPLTRGGGVKKVQQWVFCTGHGSQYCNIKCMASKSTNVVLFQYKQ